MPTIGEYREATGRDFATFTDKLQKFDTETATAGEWKEVANSAFFISLGNKDVIEENLEYMQNVRNLVVNNFDFAITALTLVRDFLNLLENFMRAVLKYIHDFIYNSLDSLLRLGVYALVIPPNTNNWGLRNLPTTSLEQQASIAYRKFYDVSDENLPRTKPYQTSIGEGLKKSGRKFEKLYDSFYRTDFAEGDKKYTRSDFINVETSIDNLSRPLGTYDGLFLYFSLDITENIDSISAFLDSILGLANIFQLQQLEGMHDDMKSLFNDTSTKKIKVLTDNKLSSLSLSTFNPSTKLEQKNQTSGLLYPVDENLENIFIVPADPILNMSEARKEKLEQDLANQGAIANTNFDIATNSANAVFQSAFQENLDNDFLEGRLGGYSAQKEDIKDIKTEIIYWEIVPAAKNILDDLSRLNLEEDNTVLNIQEVLNKHYFQKDSVTSAITKYSNESSIGKNIYAELRSFQEVLNEYNRASAISSDMNTSFTNLFNDIKTAATALKNKSTSGDLEGGNPFTMVTEFYDSTVTREVKLKKYEEDLIDIMDKIRKDTEEQFLDTANTANDIVKTKTLQLEEIKSYQENNKLDLTKSAKVIYYNDEYTLANKNNLYKNLFQQTYNVEDSLIEKTSHVHTFTIQSVKDKNSNITATYDSIVANKYVQIIKVEGGDQTVLADGIVWESTEQPYNQDGGGAWAKLNFSDLTGTTNIIKNVQNYVTSLYETVSASNSPKDSLLDNTIEQLENIKESLVSLIDAIEEIITLLNFQLNLKFKVYGRYARTNGLEGYDELANKLTRVDDINYKDKPPKSSFRPSNLASVDKHLRRIKRLDPVEAEKIKEEINTLFAKKNDPANERKKSLEDKSILDAMTDTEWNDSLDAAKELGANTINKLQSSITKPFEIGSAVYTNIENNGGIFSKSQNEETSRRNKIAYLKAKIYADIARAELDYSNEFGFSLLFLSYLPKGLPFYPVRHISQLLGLNDSADLDTDIETGQIDKILDPNGLDLDFITTNTKVRSVTDLEEIQLQLSKDTNPSPSAKEREDPEAITLIFDGFRTTNSFELDDNNIDALSSDPSYFNIISSTSTPYEFNIIGTLDSNFLHGVKAVGFLDLDQNDNNITNNALYRFEFEMEVEVADAATNAIYNTNFPEINKIDVYMGVLFKGQKNAHRYATQLNGDSSEVFKFGRTKKKRFIGEIPLGVEDLTILKPYILIGYQDPDFNMRVFTFKINTAINFYRTN